MSRVSVREILKAYLFKVVFPVRKIILFESNPDFSDNTYWLFKYFAEKNLFPHYKFVWLTAKKSQRKELCGRKIICIDRFAKTYMNRLRRLYYMQAAKVIIDCNRTVFKSKEYQVRIYLGHGMPIKRVKQLFCDKARGDCDLLALVGEGFRDMYESFGYKTELCVCGYPRNEVLHNSAVADDKYILWMPTYREITAEKFFYAGYDSEFPLGIPAIKTPEEMENVDRLLGEKHLKLFIRLHPAQDASLMKISNMNNVFIADDEFLNTKRTTLYEFVSQSAALITDYSSIYYDYLLTQRPVGLTLEDAESYSKKFGFHYKDIRSELPGFKIDNVNDLALFLQQISNDEDPLLEERDSFRKKHGIEAFPSCQIITEFLQKKLKETKRNKARSAK